VAHAVPLVSRMHARLPLFGCCQKYPVLHFVSQNLGNARPTVHSSAFLPHIQLSLSNLRKVPWQWCRNWRFWRLLLTIWPRHIAARRSCLQVHPRRSCGRSSWAESVELEVAVACCCRLHWWFHAIWVTRGHHWVPMLNAMPCLES
jgi:hypothetical protein